LHKGSEDVIKSIHIAIAEIKLSNYDKFLRMMNIIELIREITGSVLAVFFKGSTKFFLTQIKQFRLQFVSIPCHLHC